MLNEWERGCKRANGRELVPKLLTIQPGSACLIAACRRVVCGPANGSRHKLIRIHFTFGSLTEHEYGIRIDRD